MNRFVPVAVGGVLAITASTLRHMYALTLHKERVDDWSEYRSKYTRHAAGTRKLRVRGKGPVSLGIYNIESDPMSPSSIPVTMPENATFEAEDGTLYVIRRGAYLRLAAIDGLRDVAVTNNRRGLEVDAGATVNVYAQWPPPAPSAAAGDPIPLEPIPMHPKASPRIYISNANPEDSFERVLRTYNRAQTPKPRGVMIWVVFTCMVAVAVGALPASAATLAGIMIWALALAIGEGKLWHTLLTRE